MIGTKLDDRYLIKSIIGEGGMAIVYLADDLVKGKEVAIKLLKEEIAKDELNRKRFDREARTIAALLHNNIVQIYDYGNIDEQLYIVMEYLVCSSLKERLVQRYYFSLEEAIDIMLQLLSGVSHAHQNNVIHRDIKPQNILIKADNTIKLGDFGIAIFEHTPQITEQNFVMGSIHYMAPEVTTGEKASPQSDIYSCGITFFELLTGHLPYEGERIINIAMKHLKEPLPSIRKINKQIPVEIEKIIEKACAKNKFDRYITAEEMYDELYEFRYGDKKSKGTFFGRLFGKK